jgi:hypothetical protein
MSIEVTGNFRPGKPTLAIVVSAVLLVLTLAGAAALSYVRNRPVELTSPQNVPAVPGLKVAWPKNWPSVQPPTRTGPIVAGVRQGTGRGSPDNALFLLAERVSDSYVPPQFAAPLLLQSSTQQLATAEVGTLVSTRPARRWPASR